MKLLAKVGSLALIAAVAGGVVAGCSSNDVSKQGSAKGSEGPSGMIGLSLQPVSGVTLNSVHFVVTKPGSATPVLEGDLPTPGTAQTFSFGLPLPVGTGYTISLSATSVENAKVTCVGSSTFDVVANVSTAITLPLTCSDTSNGGVKGNVTVKTDLCPRLSVDFVVATPSSQNVPGNIAVAGSAHDLDGKPIQFAWKVSNPAVGTFAPANASTSTFKCVTGSPTPVTLTLTANNGECSKSLTEDVSCVNVTCGNGALDAGEACDPSVPGTTGCLPNCTKAVCGNGTLETPVEQCDPVPADPSNCTATCQIRPAVCGDTFKEAAEACDASIPGGDPTCDATCHKQVVQKCNDGTLTPPEVCDLPFSANDCGGDCLTITSATCLTCEKATSPGASAPNCTDFIDCGAAVGNAAAGTPAAGVAKSLLCNQTLDCVRDSGCAAGGKAPISCYCGTADGAACQAGNGNGVCKTQIERSLETTSFSQIAARIGDVAFGGGIAMARIDCDQTFCTTQCGL